MKIISMPTAILIVLLSSSIHLKAQSYAIGGFIGGGYITGESPEIGSFTSSIFIDADLPIANTFYPRLSFIYAGDINYLLPGTRINYFSFMKGVSLKGMVTQEYADNYFLEEGLGFIYLNDRTFSYLSGWNLGIALSLTAGIDLTTLNKGFRVGIGTEYAFAFGGTFPKYFSIHLETKYSF